MTGPAISDQRSATEPPAGEPAAVVGLACCGCGCREMRVVYTRPRPGGKVIRCRECRYCGRRLRTQESVVF